MTDMIEAVARAIYARMTELGHDEDGVDPAEWAAVSPDLDLAREHWRSIASAAIEAMRTPNKAMIKAAGRAMSPDRRPTPEYMSARAKHAFRYSEMIDAALGIKRVCEPALTDAEATTAD